MIKKEKKIFRKMFIVTEYAALTSMYEYIESKAILFKSPLSAKGESTLYMCTIMVSRETVLLRHSTLC